MNASVLSGVGWVKGLERSPDWSPEFSSGGFLAVNLNSSGWGNDDNTTFASDCSLRAGGIHALRCHALRTNEQHEPDPTAHEPGLGGQAEAAADRAAAGDQTIEVGRRVLDSLR